MMVQRWFVFRLFLLIVLCGGAASFERPSVALLLSQTQTAPSSESPPLPSVPSQSSAPSQSVPPSDSSPPSTERIIQPGHQGRAVARVQAMLTGLGLYALPVDGIYTDETARAIEAFQTVHHLSVTGHVDRHTWNALNQATEASTANSPSPINAQAPVQQEFPTWESSTEILNVRSAPDHDAQGIEQWHMLRSYLPAVLGGLGLGACFYVLGHWSAVRSHKKNKRLLSKPFRNSTPSFGVQSRVSSKPNPSKKAASKKATSVIVSKTTYRNPTPSAKEATSPTTIAPPVVDVVETTRLTNVTGIDTLLRELDSSEPKRRRRAIWELGQRGTTEAIHPLLDRMVTADSQQRSLMLAAIAEIGVRTLTPMNRALVLSLQDKSSDVRKNAIRDITRVYELMGQVNMVLRHAVSDEHPDVRETACWAMEQLNRVRTPPVLNDISSSPKQISTGEN